MNWQRERKAFAMITAILIIILMATVGALVMNMSGKMVQGTTAQYQREQSVLLAKSYTEYAIMAVTANDHNSSNCLNRIDGNFDNYTIRVDISYIGDSDELSSSSSCTLASATSNTVDTPESPLSIIVDVYVDYQEYDHPGGVAAPNITYHRRSLQKI